MTAPTISSLFTHSCTVLTTWRSRSDDIPTSSGEDRGNGEAFSCARRGSWELSARARTKLKTNRYLPCFIFSSCSDSLTQSLGKLASALSSGAVLFPMFYEPFEKFDDAVQTVHASCRISGTRQLVAFVGVADIFNGPIENLQATVQKL